MKIATGISWDYVGYEGFKWKQQSKKTRMRTVITKEKCLRTKIRKTKKKKTRIVKKITTRAIQG